MESSIVNVYGYIRGSTEGQVKHGYSLAEQRAEIGKYCSSKSYNLIEIFKDEGISGAKANEDEMSIVRDDLLDMLASLKENKIQCIVVLSANRLWRSDLVKVLLHRELKKNNVDIRAIDRPNYSICTQNPNEIFVNGMFELLDVYERLEIALKLKRGRLQKAKGGGYAGGVHTVSGMLLYAKTDEEVYPNNVYQMSGNQITVRTLDLNLPFDEIAAQLNAIVKAHFDFS